MAHVAADDPRAAEHVAGADVADQVDELTDALLVAARECPATVITPLAASAKGITPKGKSDIGDRINTEV